MPLNLNDWLGQTAWPWWLLVVVLLLGVAVLLRRRIVLAAAVGPAAAAGLAAAFPRPFWPQLVLAVVVAGLLAGLAALFTRRPGADPDEPVEGEAEAKADSLVATVEDD